MSGKKTIEPLVLKIEGDRITATKFMQIVQNFFSLLRTVAADVTERHDAVTWIIRAESGSQIFKATPEGRDTDVKNLHRIAETVCNGIRLIERQSRRPRNFSDATLKYAKKLAAVIGNGNGEVSKLTLSYSKKTNAMSQKTILHVDDILGAKRNEEGSVEGRVTVLSDKQRFKVYVDDILTGHSVRCTPRSVDEEELIRAFRKKILATGLVHYRKDGNPVRIEVDEIRVLGKRDGLPTFDDVKGIFRQGG